MSNFFDICFICLEHSNNLILIKSQDTNGTNFEDKLNYFLPGLELNSNIPKYICVKCGYDLSRIYEFKQKCLQNITTYEKYAEQITAIDSSNKYLSDIIRTDSVFKEADISVGNNYDKNIPVSKSEIAEIEEIIIKEESSEELVLNDKLDLLLHDLKEENIESDVTFIKTESIGDKNVQLSNNSIKNKNISEQGEKQQFKCHVCSKMYDTKVELRRHFRLHGIIPYKCENNDDKSSNNEDLEQAVLKYNETLYKCKICDKSFECWQTFEGHQLTHTNGEKYCCEICDKSFRQLQPFKDHCTIHTGEKSYTCEVCNKSFRHLQNFQRHKMLHTDEKPYTCEVCQKSFQQLHILKRHRLLHSGEKPFPCDICNKSFRQIHHLKEHHFTHTGEKPFTCEVCNKSFRILSTLKTHKYQHTGERPYTCEVCNKSFRQLHVLKDHKLIHTGEKPFSCEVCNKSFRLLRVLKRHKLLHTNEKLKKETYNII